MQKLLLRAEQRKRDEDEVEEGMKQKHLCKAFYCVLSHKMGFSSPIKSKSSEKKNIFPRL